MSVSLVLLPAEKRRDSALASHTSETLPHRAPRSWPGPAPDADDSLGRHTFIDHALAGRRTLAEVRDTAGHANVSITSAYLHVAVEDQAVGNLSLFG
jgi:hypothetical protein